jgi:hypothetical protein
MDRSIKPNQKFFSTYSSHYKNQAQAPRLIQIGDLNMKILKKKVHKECKII